MLTHHFGTPGATSGIYDLFRLGKLFDWSHRLKEGLRKTIHPSRYDLDLRKLITVFDNEKKTVKISGEV